MESFSLHTRNLLSFLYERPGKDSAVAADFIDGRWRTVCGPKSDVLRVAHIKTSKEITHLLYHRTKLTDEQKTWHIEPIVIELAEVLRKFADAVPESRVQDGFRERVNSLFPRLDVTLSAHGLSVASAATTTLAQLKARSR